MIDDNRVDNDLSKSLRTQGLSLENRRMPPTVVLVGHCRADTSYLRITVSRASRDAKVLVVDDESRLRHLLDGGGVHLVLVNRTLDWGFATDSGVELIRGLRAAFPTVAMMLVSNYPDAQQAAVAVGALPGFGKREIGTPRVTDVLRAALAHRNAGATPAVS
jgi:two-component system chemotaxis response regulator CheY